MEKCKSLLFYFSKGEIMLWCLSIMLIIISFLVFGLFETWAADLKLWQFYLNRRLQTWSTISGFRLLQY